MNALRAPKRLFRSFVPKWAAEIQICQTGPKLCLDDTYAASCVFKTSKEVYVCMSCYYKQLIQAWLQKEKRIKKACASKLSSGCTSWEMFSTVVARTIEGLQLQKEKTSSQTFNKSTNYKYKAWDWRIALNFMLNLQIQPSRIRVIHLYTYMRRRIHCSDCGDT